jgi:hypothetical protein
MDKQARRALLRDFKERKVEAGVFALRCAASGDAWVGSSKNLAQQSNAIDFALKMGPGGRLHPALHAAYAQHGAGAIRFEVLEAVDDEALERYGLDARLKDRLVHWQGALAARRVFG